MRVWHPDAPSDETAGLPGLVWISTSIADLHKYCGFAEKRVPKRLNGNISLRLSAQICVPNFSDVFSRSRTSRLASRHLLQVPNSRFRSNTIDDRKLRGARSKNGAEDRDLGIPSRFTRGSGPQLAAARVQRRFSNACVRCRITSIKCVRAMR